MAEPAEQQMTYGRLCRRATDPNEPLVRRYLAYRQAVETYSWLTGTSFKSVCAELEARFDLLRRDEALSKEIAGALQMLGDARSRFLIAQRAVGARRAASKRLGRLHEESPYEQELGSLVVLGKLRPREPSPLDEPFISGPSWASKPAFGLGEAVHVLPNTSNRTLRSGVIRACVWHHRRACWFYLISQDGRRIKKRYFEEDLRREL
ncbi:MAG: hypothetical protein U0271_43375 [Polyangiaceae bacterium]